VALVDGVNKLSDGVKGCVAPVDVRLVGVKVWVALSYAPTQ
jgi:hypothetical protein